MLLASAVADREDIARAQTNAREGTRRVPRAECARAHVCPHVESGRQQLSVAPAAETIGEPNPAVQLENLRVKPQPGQSSRSTIALPPKGRRVGPLWFPRRSAARNDRSPWPACSVDIFQIR